MEEGLGLSVLQLGVTGGAIGDGNWVGDSGTARFFGCNNCVFYFFIFHFVKCSQIDQQKLRVVKFCLRQVGLRAKKGRAKNSSNKNNNKNKKCFSPVGHHQELQQFCTLTAPPDEENI